MNRRLVALPATLVLIGCVSTASAESGEGKESLVARYLEWRGGKAFTDAVAIVQKGELEISGLSGPVTVVQTRDGRQYLNADLNVIEITEVLLPRESWFINPSGQIEDMGSVPETNARRGLAFELGLPLLQPDSNVMLMGYEERDNRTWAVLRIAYEDGDYHDLFIDETSGALEWTRVRQDTEVFWLQYQGWNIIEGVHMPGVRRELHEIVTKNATFTWSESQINPAVSDFLFDRPSAKRRVTIADGAPSTHWIPFDFYRRQRVFLPARINGVDTYAVLDSGAEMTALDAEMARAAGLTGSGSVTAEGTGGTTDVQIAAGVAIGIDNLELRDMTVAILDLSELGRRLLGRSIPVILGKEVFNEMVVDIDYPNSRIAFHDPDRWTYDGEGTTVVLPELGDSRVVEISVEGGDPILANFDIGQGSTLALFEAYVRASGLLDGRRTSTQRGGGVGGEVISTVTTLRTLTFGGVEFESVPVSLSIGAEGSFDTTREQGNLGTGVFNRFRLIVHYGADELYLEPDEARIHAEFDRNRAGVQLQIGKRVGEVTHVMAGSPAEAVGLAVGDRVTAINGRAIADDYWTTNQWRWLHGPAGTVVKLSLADGREIELTLTDFF